MQMGVIQQAVYKVNSIIYYIFKNFVLQLGKRGGKHHSKNTALETQNQSQYIFIQKQITKYSFAKQYDTHD